MAFDQFHQTGATSQMIEVSLRSSSTGQLLTGVAFGGVTAKYLREGAASHTTVSVVTMTQGTFTSGGWVETGIAGVYQFGIPDAALATGAKAVTLVFSASGALDVVKRIVLVAEDLRDALISSRLAPTTAGRTLNVGADGIAEANVKQWHGVAPATLTGGLLVRALIDEGVHGGVGATLTLGRLTLSDSTMGGKALVIQATNPAGGKAIEINGGWKAIEVTGDVEGLPGLSAQEVRDAMMLAPSAGTPAAESVDAKLDSILEDTGTALPALFAASGATVTVISAVDGDEITVRVADTWSGTATLAGATLSDYEAIALVAKRSEGQADTAALLYLRSDTGLERIGGAAPAAAANGTLSKTPTTFTFVVTTAETTGLRPGRYRWWLKGFDTATSPAEAVTLATGEWVLEPAGLAATA